MPAFFCIALVLLLTVTPFDAQSSERAALFPIAGQADSDENRRAAISSLLGDQHPGECFRRDLESFPIHRGGAAAGHEFGHQPDPPGHGS